MTDTPRSDPVDVTASDHTHPHDIAPARVLLDMDTGVDDAVAIVLAVNSPELEVAAVTSVAGNAPVTECTRNSLLITELLLEHDAPPVFRGADTPLARSLVIAPEVHGGDGLGGLHRSLPDPHYAEAAEPAHEALARIATAAVNGRRPVLIATGPLTNLALALERDAHALDGYGRIVIMGGAFDVPGNTGPVAEFNFYVDPEAAGIVMRSGLDITLVPLDATTSTALPRPTLERYAARAMWPGHRGGVLPGVAGCSVAPPTGRVAWPDPAARPGRDLARILYRALDYYIAFQEWESGLSGGYMHDPLAVAVVIAPDMVETEDVSVDVLTDGTHRGRSVARRAEAGRAVHLVRSVDADRFLALVETRVLAPVFSL